MKVNLFEQLYTTQSWKKYIRRRKETVSEEPVCPSQSMDPAECCEIVSFDAGGSLLLVRFDNRRTRIF